MVARETYLTPRTTSRVLRKSTKPKELDLGFLRVRTGEFL